MGPYLAVAEVIKAYLKANKISQAQLALRLELPQSTLKKWLNAKDGSVNRLNHICQDLGLSLSEVMKSVEKREVQVNSRGYAVVKRRTVRSCPWADGGFGSVFN